MKRILCLVPLAVLCATSGVFAAEPIADVFREGLFEEEANRNLPAAIEAYEEVVRRLDEQRRLAATAVFRLGECHRKLGQTNEAIAAFERVAREFPGEETLVKLSRENLTLLRPREIPVPTDQPQPDASGSEAMNLTARIATLSAQLAAITNAPNAALMAEAALAVTSDARLGKLLEAQLTLEQELAAKRAMYSYEHPGVRVLMERLKTVSDEIDERVSTLRMVCELQIGALKQSLEHLAAGTRGSEPAPATSEEAEEIRRIQALVANSPDLINAQPERQTTTPLMNAAMKGQLAVARYLLDHGARVNQASSDDDGRTALSLAVGAGHRTMAELLIDRGATVTPQVAQTPLHLAALRGFVSLAELLVSRGADVNYQWDGRGGKSMTPLWRAVQSNHEPMARFLLDHRADPNLAGKGVLPNPEPSTPLTVADSAAMVQLLLDHGADPNADNSARLMQAIDDQNAEVLTLLLNAGAKVNVQAIALGQRKDGQYGPLTGSERVRTPLSFAISKGWMAGARLLRKQGADVNLADADDRGVHWPPLHFAVSHTNPEAVRWLLSEGAKVDAKDALGRTALDIVMGGMSPLLAGPASLNLRVPQPPGEQAPTPAVWDVVLVLVKAGADPMTSVNGFPLIHYAVAAGRIDVLEALKERSVGLDVRGSGMITPLMVAVGMNQADALDWLLRNGADVNLQDEDGNTALHFAAWRHSVSLVKRLLDAGASRSVLNALEKTPAQFTNRGSSAFGSSFGLLRFRGARGGQIPAMPPVSLQPFGTGEVFMTDDGSSSQTSDLAALQQLLAPDAPAPAKTDEAQSP